MTVPEARRLLQLEEENSRLKRLVAEQALDFIMLKDVLGKKLLKSTAKKHVMRFVRDQYGYSERRDCRVLSASRCTIRRSIA